MRLNPFFLPSRPFPRVPLAILTLFAAQGECQPAAPVASTVDAAIPEPATPAATRATTAAAPPAPPFVGPPLSRGVLLDLHVDGIDAGLPVLFGETNLPDDTELELQVSDMDYLRSPPGKPAKGFLAQAKAIVLGGRFRMQGDSFSDRGKRVHAGEWEAEVMEPYPFLQPASVQAVIGPKGEHLKGPLVFRDEFGVLVERKVRFTVR